MSTYKFPIRTRLLPGATALVAVALLAGPAGAQSNEPSAPNGATVGRPKTSPKTSSEPRAGRKAPGPMGVGAAVADSAAAVPQAPASTKNDRLARALAPETGGLTLKQVALRAIKHDPDSRAKKAEVAAAKARLNQAIAAYIPRLNLSASYTRLSPVENKLDAPSIPGVDPNLFAFPVILNQYQLVASLEVPLSDYLLRLSNALDGANHDVDAKKLQRRAAELQAAAQGKLIYLEWVRSRGQYEVSKLAETRARTHLVDARRSFQGGLVTQADVLRLEAQSAQSKHLVAASKNLTAVSEERLRIVLQFKKNETLKLGVNVLVVDYDGKLGALAKLQQQAVAGRLELAAVRKSVQSLESAKKVAVASYAPQVSAFGNVLYGNPNPRVFPQADRWDLTWQLGARLSWSLGSVFMTHATAKERGAQVSALKGQAAALRRGIRSEVTSAYYQVLNARSARKAAQVQLRAARAGLDAVEKLFRAGRLTAAGVVDAQAALSQAQFQRINAYIDLLGARVRLEHALGT